VSFHGIIDNLLLDTQSSLRMFRPELALCGTILLLLVFRIAGVDRRLPGWIVALAGSIVGFLAAGSDLMALLDGHIAPQEIFTGLLVYDSLTIFFRTILLLFAVLFCVLTRTTGIPDNEDSPDYYSLFLGATLGMCLMASANHLLMVFLAVEMASVPSYVLAGVMKGRRVGSEAAIKYSVYGAGTAGVMLYGISLICGVLGTAHLPTAAVQLADMDLPAAVAAGSTSLRVLSLGGLMMMVGLAFKLSAVPFHFWCPDVFEGATAEVNAFLSVASKAAALALLVRVATGLAYPHDLPRPPEMESAASVAAAGGGETGPGLLSVKDGERAQAALSGQAALGGQQRSDSLQPARTFIVQMLAFIAAITCTFGNLAAYGQNNLKRLLAYSTIAHAGYMIMPVAAAVAACGSDLPAARASVASLAFYVAIYLFMNLGAFAVVAFLRNAARSEDVADFAGLVRTAPVTVICFALMFFSLIGLPPLAGFAAKFVIFESLVTVGGSVMYTLLFIAGLNTAISLVYYLRVIKIMTIDPEPDTRGPIQLGWTSMFTVLVTVPVVVLGVWFDFVYRVARRAAEDLFL